MIIATARAAETRVYWINALGHERARLNGSHEGMPMRDYAARLEALGSGLFENPLLTRAAKNALISRRDGPHEVLRFSYRTE